MIAQGIIQIFIHLILGIALFTLGLICYFFIILDEFKNDFWKIVKEEMNERDNGKNR